MDISSLIPQTYKTIYDELKRKYSPEIEKIQIKSKEYLFLKPGDISFIGQIDFDNSLNFPYWVKIWDASIVLSEFLISINENSKSTTNNKTLELGAGLGVSGIIAADNGYDVTITDYDQEILNFPRISCELNGIKTAKCQLLDWKRPDKLDEFDIIIGSELVYHKSLFEPLINVIKRHLKPNGVVYLAQDSGRKSLKEFLEMCSKDFNIAIRKRTLKTSGEKTEVLLIRLNHK